MKLFLNIFFITITFCSLSKAADTKSPSTPPPFQITLLEDKKSTAVIYENSNKDVSIFRVQFKILNDSVKNLDVAKVYFYNDKRELIDTLTNFGTQFLGASNTLKDLHGLDKNKLYNLEFTYQKGTVKWKYLVAVIGTKEQVVGRTLPSSEKPANFDFPEKDKLAN
jgi:hypothetical protein